MPYEAMTVGGSSSTIGRRNFLRTSFAAVAAAVTPWSARAQETRPEPYFPGFERKTIETSGTTINLVVGGSGSPVLLLHGFPETHLAWRKIAPDLAKEHTVVAADLRGYGDSGHPPDDNNHFGHSKRAMAQDQIEIMAKLGFDRFSLAGHDRGARVAHRLALDHPEQVSKLVLMDISPTYETFKTIDRKFATNNWYWFFLLQPSPFPETLIGNSLDAYLKRFLSPLMPKVIEPDVYAEYFRCLNDPAALHSYCEDYRASATIDLDHDEADLSRKLACPTRVLWGAGGFRGKNYDMLATWQDRASDLSGKGLPSGHFLAEEAPTETLDELKVFFAA